MQQLDDKVHWCQQLPTERGVLCPRLTIISAERRYHSDEEQRRRCSGNTHIGFLLLFLNRLAMLIKLDIKICVALELHKFKHVRTCTTRRMPLFPYLEVEVGHVDDKKQNRRAAGNNSESIVGLVVEVAAVNYL